MSELKCFRCGGHCECGLVFCGGTKPFREPGPPAPMTMAARVLQGMERDPYEGRCRSEDHDIGKEMKRLDGIGEARLRMARMSLDRPLDAEQARWERLVCSKVPVGRR